MIASVSMTSDGASATLLGSFTCGNSARYFISIVTFNLIQTTCTACCQWGWVRIRVSGSSSSSGSASARAGTSGISGSSVSVSTSATSADLRAFLQGGLFLLGCIILLYAIENSPLP